MYCLSPVSSINKYSIIFHNYVQLSILSFMHVMPSFNTYTTIQLQLGLCYSYFIYFTIFHLLFSVIQNTKGAYLC